MRWKPLLGKGKKEIACERVIEKQGRRQQGEAETPPLFAHPPVYNSPFQQDHSRWGGSVDVLFLRVNSIEPSLGVCCAEDPVNCVPPCVSSIYLSSVSFCRRPPPPQKDQSEVSAFINRDVSECRRFSATLQHLIINTDNGI